MTARWHVGFWLAALAAFLLAVYLLHGMLLPFVAGMAVAYFLDPLADRLERLGLSRLTATIVITGGFFLLLMLALALVVPVLEGQLVAFAGRLPDYLRALSLRLDPLVGSAKRYLSPHDLDRLRDAVGNYAGTMLGWLVSLLNHVLSGGIAIVNVLSLVFITPVVTFYLLRDWETMVTAVDSWLPRAHAETIRAQFLAIDRTLAGFVRGQATVCLTLGLYYGLALSLAGLDIGLVVGMATGMLSFIPYVGSMSGFVVAMGLALAQSPNWTLPGVVLGIYLVGQLVEGNVLTPRLVGNQVGLHPVWVIFALLAGGALFGFLGILLAVPVAAVIGVLIRFGLHSYLASTLYEAGAGPEAE